MFGPDGNQCSTFTLSPDNGKGRNEKDKPTGLFCPVGARLDDGSTVFVVEGVKDAAALSDLGYLAIGLPGNRLNEKFAGRFRGMHVVIVPDADKAGENGAVETAKVLYGVAASVKVAKLPAETKDTKGADVRDVLAMPAGREKLVVALEAARPVNSEGRPKTEKYPIGAPEVVMACTLTRKEVCWLWPNRIPLGKLTLLIGDPGLGKSLLTLDLAAVVSAGLTWPNGAAGIIPSGVVLLSAEDGLEDTIVPRLDAAGANRERIGILKGVKWYDAETKQETVDMFSLQRDIGSLEKAIATVPETKLVIVDPISAYLGNTDSHKNSEVRAVLAPLAELAERTKTAIVALQHLNKGTGPAIYRATGSLAFVAAARAVWGIVKDKQNPSTRLVIPIKCNLSPDVEGMSYTVTESPDYPSVPIIAWSRDPVRVTADDALSEQKDSDHREVDLWLSEMLADGRMAVKDVQKVARESGHNWRTVERAKTRLKAVSSRDGFGRGAVWYWSLPDDS